MFTDRFLVVLSSFPIEKDFSPSTYVLYPIAKLLSPLAVASIPAVKEPTPFAPIEPAPEEYDKSVAS